MKGRKNILILTQWTYKDPLIQAYTLPYVFIIARQLPPGSKIYLVTFEQEKLRMKPDEKKKIKKHLLEKGITLIDYTYHQFSIKAIIHWFFTFLQLVFISLFSGIKYIHAWCTTAGSLAYMVSLLTGKKLVIDSYEPHAEAMVENGTWSRTGIKFKTLFFFEKKLSHRASFIISATEGMHEYAKRKYGIDLKNFFVKPACVDQEIFNLSKRKNIALVKELNLDGKIVCVYAGKFGGIYLTEEVFNFFREAELLWGDRFRALLLTPNKPEELNSLAEKSKFDKQKMIIRFIAHDEIPIYMGLGDFAITPVKPIPTKRYCTPIKDGEYWALGLPVVITEGISDDSDIIRHHEAGAVLKDLSASSYKESLRVIDGMLHLDKNLVSKKIAAIANQYRSFEIAEKIYSEIYGKSFF